MEVSKNEEGRYELGIAWSKLAVAYFNVLSLQLSAALAPELISRGHNVRHSCPSACREGVHLKFSYRFTHS
jgi:hypothetical protein